MVSRWYRCRGLCEETVAFTIKVLSVPKTTLRKLLASDGYPKYVENHPLVFGTVTDITCCDVGDMAIGYVACGAITYCDVVDMAMEYVEITSGT
jgi:hypothetical protein